MLSRNTQHPNTECFAVLVAFWELVSSFGLAVDGLGWDGPGWDGPGGDVSCWDVPVSDDPGWDVPGLVELPGEVGVAGSVTGGMASFSS